MISIEVIILIVMSICIYATVKTIKQNHNRSNFEVIPLSLCIIEVFLMINLINKKAVEIIKYFLIYLRYLLIYFNINLDILLLLLHKMK